MKLTSSWTPPSSQQNSVTFHNWSTSGSAPSTTVKFDIAEKTYAAGTHLLATVESGQLKHNNRTGYGEMKIGCSVRITESYTTLSISYITSGSCYMDRINRASAICSSANVGENAKITITDSDFEYATEFRYEISYQFGSQEGWVRDTPTKKGTISWQLPYSFLSEFGPDEMSKRGTLNIIGYYNSSNNWVPMGNAAGVLTIEFIALLDASIAGPTINPTVTDTNSTTLALTGNSSTLVRYYSDAYIDTGVETQEGATLKSVITTWNNQKLYAATGTFPKIETNTYTIEAVDSRGLTTIYNGTISSFVEYDKLTCNIFPDPIDTDGNLTFRIEGNFFNGSFGAVNNTLVLKYRYKTKEGSYGSWQNVAINPTGTAGYTATINLTGLNYKEIYVFEAQAADKLITINSAETTIASYPVFDWSKTDFNFNVPVTAQDSFSFAEDKGVYGKIGDEEVSALIPLDSTGNTVVGFGGYNREQGATKVYGNSIDFISHGDITFNGDSFKGLMNAVTQSYSFTPTVARGANYTSASCSLTLRGNCLYCRFYGSRSAASGTGDFTDELIAAVTFDHGGKITAMDYVNGIAGTSGPTAALSMADVNVSGNTASFNMMLSNSAAAGRNFLTSFVIPVSINPSAFV